MSRSNAAAIRRRVTNVQNNTTINGAPSINIPPVSVPPPPVPANQASTLNPRQLLIEIDKRVNTLEESLQTTNIDTSQASMIDVIEEFNGRFEIIATEMSDLKDTIMKLQTYTMDVNKMLLGERIHILSEIPNTKTESIDNLTDMDNTLSRVDMRELVQEEIEKE